MKREDINKPDDLLSEANLLKDLGLERARFMDSYLPRYLAMKSLQLLI